MKKSLLIAASLIAFGVQPTLAHQHAAQPATPDADLSLTQRAAVLTRAFVNRLRLNEADYIHLQLVHRILIVNLDEIDANYANDLTTRRTKLVELQGYYEQERLRVLTPIQASRLADKSTKEPLPAVNTESGGLG